MLEDDEINLQETKRIPNEVSRDGASGQFAGQRKSETKIYLKAVTREKG